MSIEKTDLKPNLGQDINVERKESVEDGRANVKEAHLIAAAKGQGISGYEELTVWQTVKAFKVCTATCFLVAFSAATDGYQIGSVFLKHTGRKRHMLTLEPSV